jgi:hypothetical protein
MTVLVVLGGLRHVQAGWPITQITNNSYGDSDPQVSGSNVVWYGNGNLDPLDLTTDGEIFMVTIPEPTTLALSSMGALALLAYAWRRRR